MKNRTDKQFEITLPDSIIIRNLAQARDSASRSAKCYLEEAKHCEDITRAEALEALAFERALIADQIEEIVNDRFGIEVGKFNSESASNQESNSVNESEKKLKRACEKLYRRCHDTKLKRYLRDLRTNLFGLASSYTSATAASISM